MAKRVGPPSCKCLRDSFSDDVDLETCVVCEPPCRRCNSISSTDCSMCIDEYYLVDTECIPC